MGQGLLLKTAAFQLGVECTTLRSLLATYRAQHGCKTQHQLMFEAGRAYERHRLGGFAHSGAMFTSQENADIWKEALRDVQRAAGTYPEEWEARHVRA